MATWLKRILAAIWAALTTPAPSSEGGGSSPPIEPDNPVTPPDDGGGAGSPRPPWGPLNPMPNDPDTGGYDSGSKWKAVSGTTGKLVVITGYQWEFTTLTIGARSVSSSGRANGHRQHWRFPHPGAWYGAGVDVCANAADGTRYVARVGNGARDQRLLWDEVVRR